MTKMTTRVKLSLGKQTLRTLSQRQLHVAAGGGYGSVISDEPPLPTGNNCSAGCTK